MNINVHSYITILIIMRITNYKSYKYLPILVGKRNKELNLAGKNIMFDNIFEAIKLVNEFDYRSEVAYVKRLDLVTKIKEIVYISKPITQFDVNPKNPKFINFLGKPRKVNDVIYLNELPHPLKKLTYSTVYNGNYYRKKTLEEGPTMKYFTRNKLVDLVGSKIDIKEVCKFKKYIDEYINNRLVVKTVSRKAITFLGEKLIGGAPINNYKVNYNSSKPIDRDYNYKNFIKNRKFTPLERKEIIFKIYEKDNKLLFV